MQTLLKIRCLAVLLLLSGSPATAETLDEWSFDRSLTTRGVPLCSIYVSPYQGGAQQMLAIQKYKGENYLHLKLYRSGWALKPADRITAVIAFSRSNRISRATIGKGNFLDIVIPQDEVSAFYALLRDSATLNLSFPELSEPSWQIRLDGAKERLAQLNQCAMDQRAQEIPF